MNQERELLKRVREIPTRIEQLGGQNYKYVRLEEVLHVLEEFQAMHRPEPNATLLVRNGEFSLTYDAAILEDGNYSFYADSPQKTISNAIFDVISERKRQVKIKRFTESLDDAYKSGELVSAACAYALEATFNGDQVKDTWIMRFWPWDIQWFKHTNTRRSLVKSAALLIAEIERIDRIQGKSDINTGEKQ